MHFYTHLWYNPQAILVADADWITEIYILYTKTKICDADFTKFSLLKLQKYYGILFTKSHTTKRQKKTHYSFLKLTSITIQLHEQPKHGVKVQEHSCIITLLTFLLCV